VFDTFELAVRFHEMLSDLSENLQLLREVRGSFQDHSKNQTVEWCVIFIFLLIVPVALATLFLITRPLAMNSDHWILAVMIVGSLFTGFSVFVERGLVEYEFTGDEIIEKLRGRIKMQIHIIDVTDVKVFYLGRHISILKTSQSEMKILRIPSLVAAIIDQANKMNARMSEGEREQAKKMTLQQVSSLKRTTLVAMILYTVVVAALAVCIRRLVDKLQLK
jgi:hypothetical protein